MAEIILDVKSFADLFRGLTLDYVCHPEKLHQRKAQQEKLKAVKARLNFKEASRCSESKTSSRGRNLKERLGPRDVKGALECMKISGFMHGITNPELIKRLHDKIPKLMDEMLSVTTSFLRGEVAASNQERKKSFPSWKQQEAGQKQNFTRDGTEGPMTIEAEIGGHYVHRMYVDGGSSLEILYEHCFSKFRLEIKNQLIPANTPLVEFSGEIIWTLGQKSLLVKIGDEEHSTSAWMNFMVVRSPSPYNEIIERPGLENVRGFQGLKQSMPQRWLFATENRLEEAEMAFKGMKQLIAELPMLTAPKEKEELIMYLAAAKEAISQLHHGASEGRHTRYINGGQERTPKPMDIIHGQIIMHRRFQSRLNNHKSGRNGCHLCFKVQIHATNNEAEYEAIWSLNSQENRSTKSPSKCGLKTRSQPELKEKSIDEKEILAVVEEEGHTWMTPVYEYLTERILPEEKRKQGLCAAKQEDMP
nr:reverse transcriptase domain-containing protein [Tanacetum cinerariifolium]